MVRAPCCEKMGLKKGPWSPDEDQTLITYIQKYGHGNWRALPKQAGLLRCGKSCRLRWMNYLRPDVKRGNFSREEEETIIKLHEMLGNRWSAIAAKLPGRTDNEIKNVWHTHLKKRIKQSTHNVVAQEITKRHNQHSAKAEVVLDDNMEINNGPTSPPQSSTVSYISSITITDHDNNNNNNKNTSMKADAPGNFSDIAGDETFWSEVLSTDQSNYSETLDDFSAISEPKLQFPFWPLVASREPVLHAFGSNNMYNDDMDFWHNIFTKAEDLQELLAEL